MGVGRPERDLPAGDRILLDTTLLAAYLDASEPTHPVARHVLSELVCPGRNPAVVSMVTVMEILVRPLQQSPSGHHTVLDFLRDHPGIDAVPLDLQMAQDAAWLRAELRSRPPDAFVIATAISCQVGHVVTNDHDWSAKLARLQDRLKVIVLDEYID